MGKDLQNLRVGFCYDDSLDKTDGVAQYVKNLGQWLSSQGHHVFYMVGETHMKQWAGGRVYSLAKNKKVIFNGNSVNTPLPANRRRIKEVLRVERPDILHVQVPYSPFMAGRVITSATPEIAVVGTFHILPANVLARWGASLLRLFCLRTLKHFSRIVSVSPPAAAFARRSFGVDSVASSNVMELGRFSQVKERPHPNHVVFLGRLVKRKGCVELLQAFTLLIAKIPGAKLSIAGDGPQRAKLEAIVKKNKLESSVKFLGFISEADKPNLLASAQIACFPATGGESFGIVLIEAMAAGAGVVVGGNNPGYASVLGENSQALVDPGDSHDFAARLEKILTDQKLAARLHEQQQEQVKQYDVAIVGNRLLEIYEEAIASRRQKP